MKFSNTAQSYEKPESGWHPARLVGFAFVGTHEDLSGQYGPRPRVMLRWELYRDGAPLKDAKGYALTIGRDNFPASLLGETNRLRECLACHGIDVGDGANTDSTEWLGKTTNLFVELKGDGKYANVTAFELSEPTDQFPPQVLKSEHWEPADGTAPPEWAQWALGRSTDLAHLGKTSARGGAVPANGAAAQRTATTRPGAAATRPGVTMPRPGTTPMPEEDESDIPF